MDHTDITNVIDPATLATLNVRMPQLPTSSTELSQQISDDTRKISRPCLNRVVTCVPTSRWVPDAHATQCMAPDCRQQFTFFNRKHHCRVCGKIFCTNCCSKQLSAPAVYAAALTTEETNRLAYQQHQQQQNEVPAASGGVHVGGGADLSAGLGAARARTHGHVRSTSSGVGAGGGDSEKREGGSGDANGAKSNSRAGSASPTLSSQTAVTTTPTTTVYLSSLQQPKPSMVSVKVCRECFYDHQLAICRRDVSTAEPRRRQRGELKMVQRARLIQICSYLPLTDLFNFSLVCSDFYFITRDNAIWIWHNAARWPDKRLTGRAPVPPALISGNYSNAMNNGGSSAAMNSGSTGAGGGTTAPSYAIAKYRPNSDDDLSYHCSYNFTQFLHYCHLLEATRCEGLSNFAHSARQLLSGYVKVVVIGPENIGKTLMIQRFLNGGLACVGPSLGGAGAPDSGAGVSAGANTATSASVAAGGGLGLVSGNSSIRHATLHHHPNCVYPLVPAGSGATAYRPTAGIAVSQKQVVVAGGLSLESSGLTIIDVAGHARYDKLRALACRGAHAIIMCYSVHSKKSLIDAAMQAFALEQELGPQPIIVCGIACPPAGGVVPPSAASPLTQQPFEVTPVEAAPSSGRGRASIQVTPTVHGGAEAFSAAVQAILEKLMDGGRHASELLGLSTNPSVLDVLLDLKG